VIHLAAKQASPRYITLIYYLAVRGLIITDLLAGLITITKLYKRVFVKHPRSS